jgi:regulator of RNase E activity RraA
MSSKRLSAPELTAARRVLRSALVADALDSVGLRNQTLSPDITCLAGSAVIVGRAFTVTAKPVEGLPEVPYIGLRRALESIARDDVFVLGTARAETYATWGEVVSMAARARGAVGFVTDGLVRDRDQVDRLDFPVYARGTTPRDINGRSEVADQGLPTVIGGVTVTPGDLIVGDRDGVVVVPQAVQREVISVALAKASTESMFRSAVAGGMPVLDALDRHGIL